MMAASPDTLTSKVLASPEKALKDAFRLDGYLVPFGNALKGRYEYFRKTLEKIESCCPNGGLEEFSRGYERMGFTVGSNGITYREWAPGAKEAYLIDDWNRDSHCMARDEYGVWSIELPVQPDGSLPIAHGSKIKISMVADKNGERVERIPAWIRRAESNSENFLYEGIFWNPPIKSALVRPRAPPKPDSLRIYEAHIGICSPKAQVSSFNDFREQVLPRIKDLNYNAIQLMAIMEHPYYASFGYQVTNFFAASSRFGTPEELKELIDEAHRLGLVVLLDVVHSHACKNTLDGLNEFDGTDHCYFHEGAMGRHSLWDSRLFNYGSIEVLRFLLSNLRFYKEEYGFDGFRFDGVTSMLYKHHGIGYGFSGDYREYFEGDTVDGDALCYLQLANFMLHTLYKDVITISEDVSGMPLMCRPVEECGVGFDYRLGMALPDMWIKLLKEKRDEEWDMGNIVHTLTNRRHLEKTVAYAESHDQALVGDKTLAFWLMDKEMYTHMSTLSPLTPVIDRGLALHKIIRLLTFALGGEAYLSFMGNEFGHPEWLDFPRQGNNNSFHYARRQYNLADDELLRYRFLYAFDKAMQSLDAEHQILASPQAWISAKNEGDKVIAFERAGLLWIFNLHPTQSFVEYRVGIDQRPGQTLKVVLSSDMTQFGGHNRVDEQSVYWVEDISHGGRPTSVRVYIPCRTALVLGSPTNH